MNNFILRPLLCVFFVLLSVGCAATGPRVGDQTFAFSGATRFNGEPLSSGEIIALKAEPGGSEYRTSIDQDGSYRFSLPAGPYFLMGRSKDPASLVELFSYWTNNPIQLYGDISVPVVMPFVTTTAIPERLPGKGIRGRVLLEGEPVGGAVVAAFLDPNEEFHGLPFSESAPTGDSGEFTLDVQPGKYFIIARYRATGGYFQGPLLKGDLSGFYPHNPVLLRTGESLMLDVPMVTVKRPRGTGTLVPGEAIIIEGRVTTVSGDAAPGVRVVLYSVPEMLGRPVFVSSPSDEFGQYRIEVPTSGKFFAGARSVLGRPPEPGELIGFYGGSEDHSLVLRWGDRLKGIDITVKEVW